MGQLKSYISLFTLLAVGALAGCSTQPKSPDVSDSIRKSLDQAGLKDVKVSQDREKGVVTLDGNVPSDMDKSQAETIAKSIAAGQVVADQIAVVPPAVASDAKAINSDVDKGIEKNLDAALIQNHIPGTIGHTCKNGVVTLSGTVDSENSRQQAQQVASGVPNVQQVVNELQIKDQKATSNK